MPGWHTRLWRRVKIAPGVTVNISKSGPSLSAGPRGAKVTIGRRGLRQTLGIRGTGLYMTKTSHPLGGGPGRVPIQAHPMGAPAPPGGRPAASARVGGRGCLALLGGLLVLGALGQVLGGPGSTPTPSPSAAAAAATRAAGVATTPPAASPTAAPTVTTAPSDQPALPLSVTAPAGPVSPGASATVTAKTAPKATCRIDVPANARSSSAPGSATATASGVVHWTFRAGKTAGTYPFVVTCVTSIAAASAAGTLVVK